MKPAILIYFRLHTAVEQIFGSAIHHHYSELESCSLVAGRLLPVTAVETDDQRLGPRDSVDEVIQSETMVTTDYEQHQLHQEASVSWTGAVYRSSC